MDKAIQNFDESIRVNPEHSFAYENRGACWLTKGDYDKAIQDFDRVIRLDPKLPYGYIGRGIAWELKKNRAKSGKDITKGIRILEEFMRAAPSEYSITEQLAWLYATCANPDFVDGGKSVAFATKACELSRWKLDAAIAVMAAAYARNGNYDKAVEMLEKAIKMNPKALQKKRARMMKAFKAGKPFVDHQ